MKVVTHHRVKIATIAAAWACWGAAVLLRNWWFILIGLIPYLVWNQIPRDDKT